MFALTDICPPPTAPPPAPDWDQVEAELGMRLPHDYKQLLTTYGPGQFCGFITLYQPHAANEWTDLTGPLPARLRQQIEQVRHSAREPWPLPHPPPQLFAMGVTANGDYLFWVTDPIDKPDTWTVAVNEALRAPWYTYSGTLTAFLLTVISGTTQVPLFPTDILDNGPLFTPTPASAPRTPTTRSHQRGTVDTNEIREWARANGHALPDRGRVPIEIIQAWKRANPA
ncbi:histone-like nucleoid-structuring protein Lsr2 [Streptomyces sp. NPDC056835]|uniref:Lsr2 family DNA-binding protein n=1 Tax=Streptomyces sp. NPDC056835 TaxID=3345956 RepID=UPI0036CA873A